MKFLLRLSLAASFLSAAWIGLGLGLGHGTDGVEDHGASPVFPWTQLATEGQRAEELAGGFTRRNQRLHDQHQVLEALLARRINLREAAARFRSLNRWRSPVMSEHVRHHLGEYPDDELHCQEVIFSLTYLLGSDPCYLAAVQGELERELQEHKQGNTLRLAALRAP